MIYVENSHAAIIDSDTFARVQAEMTQRRGVRLFAPALSLCGDNAAMIGVQAAFEYAAGVRADMTLNAEATAEL